MAPAARPKPTDATGVARAKEIKKNEAALKARADEITTIAAVEAQRMETEIQDPRVEPEPEIVDEVISVGGVDLADDQVVVRLIADIEKMCYGYGNEYSFKAGVKYKVPKDLANHLESLGYLYTM